jgi:DNA-binding response OmpR family regulator
MRVLLADDDEDQLGIRQMLLRRAGFESLAATDYESAISVAKKKHPECAVLDLRFPDEKSGLRLIRDLKDLDNDIQIVVLTGSVSKRFEGSVERKLVDRVIEKGEPSSILIRQLKSWQKSRGVAKD